MGDQIIGTLKVLDNTLHPESSKSDGDSYKIPSSCDNDVTKQIPMDEQAETNNNKESYIESREDVDGKIEEFLGTTGESHDLNRLVVCLTKIQETQNNVLMTLRADIEELTITNLILKQQNEALVIENKELLTKVELVMAEFGKIMEKIRSSRGIMKFKQENHQSSFHLYGSSPTANNNNNNSTSLPASEEEKQRIIGENILLRTNSSSSSSTEELSLKEKKQEKRQHNTSYLQRYSEELYNRMPQTPTFTSHHTNEFNRGTDGDKSESRKTMNRLRLRRFFKVFRRRQRSYTIPQFPKDNITLCDDAIYQKKTLL